MQKLPLKSNSDFFVWAGNFLNLLKDHVLILLVKASILIPNYFSQVLAFLGSTISSRQTQSANSYQDITRKKNAKSSFILHVNLGITQSSNFSWVRLGQKLYIYIITLWLIPSIFVFVYCSALKSYQNWFFHKDNGERYISLLLFA